VSREILLVSKPLSPPWTDSGKVYVRTLVDALPARRFRALVPRGQPYPAAHVASEEIYGDPGRYRPSLAQNLRVLLRLFRPDARVGLYHFFFAPNPRTSLAARLACRIARKPSVQTVLSVPASFEGVSRLIFGDRVVVLSEATRARLAEAGVHGALCIYPGVDVGAPVPEARRRAVRAALAVGDAPIVLYPGDLELSGAAATVVSAAPAILRAAPEARVVLACRPKTPAARTAEAALRERLGGERRVLFAGEVSDMRALVAESAVAVLPAETTFAKTDLPLVLLEALAEGVPVVVSDRPPLAEILQDDVGLAVPPAAPEALAQAALSLLGDPVRRAAMGGRARALAATRFSAAAMARAYDELYADLLS
jgi:phosphatidylinositol alpha-1,6-mannosyltransferase